MIYGLYQSAAGMLTQEYRQDVIANNLANAETAGFKREIALLAERKTAERAGNRSGPSDDLLRAMSGGVWLQQTETDFGEGPLVQTGNDMDVALAGPGFLRVEKDGRTYLTRDGRLTSTWDGRIVAASDGAQVLSAAGAPLRVNPRGGKVEVDEIGRLYQGPNRIEVGRLDVVDVADYRLLHKRGAARFSTEGVELRESPARVQQGYVENAGVEPIKELVAMLESARAYQMNAQMVTLQDQTAGRLIAGIAA